MPKTIEQTVTFKNVTPQELYETYMDNRIHAAAINAPVSINNRVGGRFKAFGENRLQGTILHLVPGRMIVQTWHSHLQWKADELESVLVLMFEHRPAPKSNWSKAAFPTGSLTCLIRAGMSVIGTPGRPFSKNRPR